ncbi:MAG: hypothetical protein H6Q90_4463 [Deltaproteobacteria bacterium]|nr:hypothetical protein [Deltaproteobacteria bacterium]
MTAPVELVRELLYYRDMQLLGGRDWGLITAFLAGSSLALPILAPLAVGSMIALAVTKMRKMRRHGITGIAMPPATPAPGATTLYGVARRFRGTVQSLTDAPQVLLEHVVVRDHRGAVLLRRTEAAPFLLDVEDRGPVLIIGVARVTSSASVLAHRRRVRRGDPVLERMGVPNDLAIAGDLEISTIVADGPGLAVTGVIEDESVAELAFHRDGGQTPVMRGRIGAPILVEDRRLIAAALDVGRA